MPVSLERHQTPDWFLEWYRLYYEVVLVRDRTSERYPGYIACKRCGMAVWHLTKHAVNVHSDDLQILPSTPRHVAEGKDSDFEGRLVLSC